MKKTIGDMWRQSTNEELAEKILEIIIVIAGRLGKDTATINLQEELKSINNFLNTEYESEQ